MTNRPFESAGFETRRDFIKKAAAGTAAVALGSSGVLSAAAQTADESGKTPWYRRTYRWGQTNINEKDPSRYDVAWWRKYWRETEVQGLVINAGGIVAYYPSQNPLEYQAQFLNGRDLFGELTRAAHEDGLVVLARMDSSRAHENFYRAHSGWFAVDANGQPYRAGGLYVACIDSPYFDEFIPSILREAIAHAHPEGATDNSWSGLDRNRICHCSYSARKFREATGNELPRKKDWDDPVYRQWVKWSLARRTEVWDLFNRVTRAAGGPDCLWMGMLSGDLIHQGTSLRDLKAICERTEMIMVDDQDRRPWIGFQENPEIGKRLHGLLGWDKVAPESMAMYETEPTFRKTSASPPEARMWVVAGFAGTIQPWWHHLGATQPDRRQFRIAEPLYRWHKAHEEYLLNRRPVATVGVVWSQENTDFYGRDRAEELVAFPYYGIVQALVRSRIPYMTVHADHISRDTAGLSLLILPNLALMTKSQTDAVRQFVRDKGGLLATGETSLYGESGEKRPDFALADVFGAHATGRQHGSPWAKETGGDNQTYLRLIPDVGRDVDGPKPGDEPATSTPRHEVLRGFEETDILPFGGFLQEVQAGEQAIVPATFIPSFPVSPPEEVWMRVPRTQIPGLVLSSSPGHGRTVYLPADIDRCFARNNFPDHGHLLANLIRWAADGDIPLRIDGSGLIDCELYRQPGRLILHLVNLTSAGTWRAPVHELTPIGPLRVSVKLPDDVAGKSSRFLVSSSTPSVTRNDRWASVEVRSVLDHEVVVFE